MAFREKFELVVDVVTGGSTSSGLGKLKSELGEADGAFEKLKVAGGNAFDFIKENAAAFALSAGTALAGFAVKAVGDFQETALGAGQLRDSLGVTADEASRLQEVAGDLGIGVGTLETSIGRMNRTAATTPEAFAAIGAEIEKNRDGTTNVTETFLNVIDALNRIEDPTKRAAAAQQILGRSWQDASELIAMGADGVRAAMEDVESAKIIDDKEIEQARKFRDTLDELKGVGESLSIAIGGSLVPALTDVGEALGDLQGPLSTATSKFQEFSDTDLGEAILSAISPVDNFKNTIEKTSEAIDVITGKASEMTVTYDAAASEAAWLAKQQEGIASVTDDLTGSFGGLIPKVDGATASEEELARRTEALARRHEEAAKRADEHARETEELRRKQLDAVGSTHDLEQATLGLESGYAALEEQTLANAQAQGDAALSDREKEQSARDLRSAELDLAGQVYSTAQAFADQAIKNGDAREKSDIMKEALGQQAAKYPGLRAEIQAYIDKLDAIPSSKTTNVNTIFRQSGQPNAGVGTNRALAEGGRVDADEPVIVGDKFGIDSPSAELFVPDQAGTVYPNFSRATGTAVGGGGVTVNLHVTVSAGANPIEAGRQIADVLVPYLRTGGAGQLRRELGIAS